MSRVATPCLASETYGKCWAGWGTRSCSGMEDGWLQWHVLGPLVACCIMGGRPVWGCLPNSGWKAACRSPAAFDPAPPRYGPCTVFARPWSCRQVYDQLSPGFSGRCTAPLLVDKRARRAVCNESSIICSNFAELARPLGGAPAAVELRPPQLVGEIDAWNERIYETGE